MHCKFIETSYYWYAILMIVNDLLGHFFRLPKMHEHKSNQLINTCAVDGH